MRGRSYRSAIFWLVVEVLLWLLGTIAILAGIFGDANFDTTGLLLFLTAVSLRANRMDADLNWLERQITKERV